MIGIRTAADYETALVRIDALMHAKAGTHEGEELDVLVDLVAQYEEECVRMMSPTTQQAVESRAEDEGL